MNSSLFCPVHHFSVPFLFFNKFSEKVVSNKLLHCRQSRSNDVFFFSVSNSLFVKVISLDSVIAKDEGTDPDYQEERDW